MKVRVLRGEIDSIPPNTFYLFLLAISGDGGSIGENYKKVLNNLL